MGKSERVHRAHGNSNNNNNIYKYEMRVHGVVYVADYETVPRRRFSSPRNIPRDKGRLLCMYLPYTYIHTLTCVCADADAGDNCRYVTTTAPLKAGICEYTICTGEGERLTQDLHNNVPQGRRIRITNLKNVQMYMSRKYKDILLLGRGVFPESKSRVKIFFSLDRVSSEKSHIVTNEPCCFQKRVKLRPNRVFWTRYCSACALPTNLNIRRRPSSVIVYNTRSFTYTRLRIKGQALTRCIADVSLS